jgi:protein tyrosine/serine phosphatase
MLMKVEWPDGDVEEYDVHDFSAKALNEFQAAMKTVAYMSQEWDVIIDDGVVTFVEKA